MHATWNVKLKVVDSYEIACRERFIIQLVNDIMFEILFKFSHFIKAAQLNTVHI